MNRSEINDLLRHGEAFFRSFGYILPPFAYLSPAEMRARRGELDTVIARRLGWDVTDFGSGDFAKRGLFLFTTRNGDNAQLKAGRGMVYAEKIMISRQDQVTPLHRHGIKAEDIINRGGAALAVQLFAAAPDGSVDENLEVRVLTDGVARRLRGGEILKLNPGESVTLMPNVHWHAFWGESGDVLVGEVSTVNDDSTDNVFREEVGRFARIDEDEAPLYLLAADFEHWLGD